MKGLFVFCLQVENGTSNVRTSQPVFAWLIADVTDVAYAEAASRNQPKKRAAKEAWQTKNAWGCQELPGAYLLCCDVIG